MNLSVYFVTPDGAEDALVLAALRGGAAEVFFSDLNAPVLRSVTVLPGFK